MITVYSWLGIIFSLLGTILFFIVILFPKISPISILRHFLLKHLLLLFIGLIFLYIDNFDLHSLFFISQNSYIFFIVWLILLLNAFTIDPNWMFKSISDPKHFSIAQTDNLNIKNDDMVIGFVSDSNTAIAWPFETMVKPRHVINDIIDGKEVLITYCPLCKSGLIFDPIINNKRHIFKVAGLFRRNLVIIDNQSGTIWQQVTGVAINGKLKGHELSLLPFEVMSWAGWRSEHPQTLLAWELNMKIFTKLKHFLLTKIFESSLMPIFPGLTKLGKDLDPSAEIFGIKIGTIKKAYPFSVLKSKEKIFDTIENKTIEIGYDKKTRSAKAVFIGNPPIPIIIEKHHWFVWKEFYPDAQIYRLE